MTDLILTNARILTFDAANRVLVLADGRIVHDGDAMTAEQALDLMKSVG